MVNTWDINQFTFLKLADTDTILADGKVPIGDPMHRLANGNVGIDLLDIK